jgi:hypothetical protein
MATKTEPVHDGEFLISEANGHQSREEITVVSGQNLVAGAVVGKITATGKYKIYDDGAVDGSEAAAGVLFGAVDAGAADKKGVIIERDAEVNGDLLNWGANNAGGITNGIADLLTKGIKVR